MTTSETRTEILRNFIFLTIIEKGQFLKKICICLNKKNCFSPQSWGYTAKLCLPVVLKIFGEIHRELFFLDIKVTISETSTEILWKFVFFIMFENGKFWGNLDLFKQLFLIKPVKDNNY